MRFCRQTISVKCQSLVDYMCRPTRLCVTVCVCEPAMCSAVTEGKSPSKQQKRIDLKWKVHADIHVQAYQAVCDRVCVEPAMCSAVTEGKSPSKQQKRIDLKWKVHADIHVQAYQAVCDRVCVEPAMCSAVTEGKSASRRHTGLCRF